MLGVARAGQDTAGGLILVDSNTSVFANGLPVAVLNNPVAGHGESPHSSTMLITGSGTVFVNGLPICRLGDSAGCGHSVSTASPNVNAG